MDKICTGAVDGDNVGREWARASKEQVKSTINRISLFVKRSSKDVEIMTDKRRMLAEYSVVSASCHGWVSAGVPGCSRAV